MGLKILSQSPAKNRDPALDAMLMVVSAMRSYAGLLEPTEDERIKEQRRAERWHNRREALRTLLDIIEWRYLLLPVGICENRQMFYEGQYGVRVTTKSMHVFGIRVARWVVGTTLHQLVPDPPPARLRIRPWRRKRGLKTQG
jgi:hypothetical protein